MVQETSEERPARAQRLLSLDVFRGVTILAMVLVNNAVDRKIQFAPLVHTQWHGWTLTDLIFPFFLFIMGTAMVFSLRRYRQGQPIDGATYRKIIQRAFVLFMLGMFLNFSKDFLRWLLGYSGFLDWHTLRLTGVLQRIGIVYLVTSLLVLHVKPRGQLVVIVGILLGYWALLAWLPNPHDYQANLSPEGNFGRVVDVTLIGESHMKDQATREPSDPTGLLGVVPSIVSALLGYWAGLAIERFGVGGKLLVTLILAGLGLVIVALVWDYAFPINKKLWTSSYVLFTAGWAYVTLAACLWAFDIKGWKRLAHPFEVVGLNPITAYVGTEFVSVVLGTVRMGGTSVKGWIHRELIAGHFADPRVASVVYPAGIVLACWFVLWVMAKRGWIIRV